MKVSILVPIYGVEDFIEECAVSLFEQTYQDLEYVFVDDCSPDNSVLILLNVMERYEKRKEQVKIIHHNHNRGSGAARATALEAASGDFLFFVDSDDVVTTDAVEKLMSVQQQTRADIVDGGWQRLYNDGCKGEAKMPLHGNVSTMRNLLLAQNTVPYNVWGRIIRRSLHVDNNIDFIEGINMAEDYCFMSRIMYVATSRTCLKDIVYFYRANESGTFGDWYSERHISSFLCANRVVGDFLAEHDTDHAYDYPYELGMLNALQHSLRTFGRKEIEVICPYRPTHLLFRLSKTLFFHKPTRLLLRFTYLILKHFYVKHVLRH